MAESTTHKSRARKRERDAPTHVRSWPLRLDPDQAKTVHTRFRVGTRVYNAVLGEFIGRCRAAQQDPAWDTARQMPRRTPDERKARNSAFHEVEQAHGFTPDAAQSFASSLRKAWVREHLPAQETQNLGLRAFDAVRKWKLGKSGRPRFKPIGRGLHSLASKDGNGALRPVVDGAGNLTGLQWGRGLVMPIAMPAQLGRRGKEQQDEIAEINAIIRSGKVLTCRIVRTVIAGRDTYRMQMVCDGPPSQRHPVGDGLVSFDLGPSAVAVAVQRLDRTWTGWVEPLAAQISLDTARLRRAQRHLDRQHRAGSPDCFNPDGTHKRHCAWTPGSTARQARTLIAESLRRLAAHRLTLHGALANRLLAHGTSTVCEKLNYVSWQKNFPASVRDRAPGLLVEVIRRKAESAGGDRLYEYSPYTTALSQTCLCGNRKKKPLSVRVHRCECGTDEVQINEHRDLFSAYLGLHVRTAEDGTDTLDLETAREGWLHRQDVDGCRGPVAHASSNRRGRRHPPSRRSVARINARRAAKRRSRSAHSSQSARPTASP